MSLLWMEYETEFEHLVENGDHAQYHPDDGRNHSGREYCCWNECTSGKTFGY